MASRFTVVCDDDQGRAIEAIAHEYGIAEEEVLRQLIELGLESIEEQPI